jgi:hypothetical protein
MANLLYRFVMVLQNKFTKFNKSQPNAQPKKKLSTAFFEIEKMPPLPNELKRRHKHWRARRDRRNNDKTLDR